MHPANLCYTKVKKDCIKFISSQETRTEKFRKKDKMIKSFLIPACFWLANRVNKKNTMIIGLAGGQGTGKTTISSLIKIILEKYFKLIVFKISFDDWIFLQDENVAINRAKMTKFGFKVAELTVFFYKQSN